MRTAVEGIPAFDAEISGVGAFPSSARPRVVWVGITSGKEKFMALVEQIETAMEKAGFAREPKGFSPHITVGRVKTSKGVEKLREVLEQIRNENTDSFKVEEVAIIKSELSSTGPAYTTIEAIALDIS